jgi:amino acid adenylation domain-containing protein
MEMVDNSVGAPESPLLGTRLSPQQKRLWLLRQQSPHREYTARCSIMIEGDLKVEALVATLQNIIYRHEILRTGFRLLPGMRLPLLVLTKGAALRVIEADFSDLSRPEQEREIEHLFGRLSMEGVDLEGHGLTATSLARISPRERLLLTSLPALYSDRRGLDNLLLEIGRGYEATLKNESWNESGLQYADLAEWQNQLLESEETRPEREYWSNKIPPDQGFFRLPFPSPGDSHRIGLQSVDINFEIELTDRLSTGARTEEDLFDREVSNVLLACWFVLLKRITGRSRIMIGTAFDGRTYDELASSIGLFAKYLPIDIELEDYSRWDEILRCIELKISEASVRQGYFDRGADEPGYDPGTDYFPICYEFETDPPVYEAPGVVFRLHRRQVVQDLWQIRLKTAVSGRLPKAELEYDAALFRSDDMTRLAAQYQRLVEACFNNVQVGFYDIELESRETRERLQYEFNRMERFHHVGACLHELIESRVEKLGDRIALVDESNRLTYSALELRANQLANQLRALGVGPDAPVAICLERGVAVGIAIFAILKAGGAYVPLDSHLPEKRIGMLLTEMGVKIVITQESLGQIALPEQLTVIMLDKEWERIEMSSARPSPTAVQPENLAYLIPTSGSTGKPKGVMIEHRQIVNYALGLQERLALHEGESFAVVSTIAADLGNTMIYGSLTTGGTLHYISAERSADAESMTEYFSRENIDNLKIVPAHLSALLASKYTADLFPKRRLVLGGEPISAELIRNIRDLGVECEIHNHYGPTETTVGVMTHKLEINAHPDEGAPMGRPLANTEVYIVNRSNRPAGVREPGELLLGGAGLARGYLNQPDLTADSFIPNSFNNRVGVRLYRTGDLTRYLPDPNVVFIGRIDHQVKIRGFRIEPGEIEAVLKTHPAVRQAVVLPSKDAGEWRLIAYLALDHERTYRAGDLREFLRDRLPRHMIPSTFVRLESFPITANGKLDIKKLREQKAKNFDLDHAFIPPRGELDQIIASIWQEALNTDKVGIGDNFFDLGGHSLLMVRVHSRLKERLKINLTLTELFQFPTIMALSDYLIQNSAADRARAEEPEPADRSFNRNQNNDRRASNRRKRQDARRPRA